MSKLRDRIRDMARRRAAGFGFTAIREELATPRQVLVVAEVADSSQAQAAASAGADALIYSGSLDDLGALTAAAGSAVVGVRIDAATAEDTQRLTAAGVAFLVVADDQAEAAALQDQDLGYLVAAQPGAEDATLRLLRALDLDGVLVTAPPERMTVRQQLQTRRLGELVRKPLFARVEAPVSAATLELWRDAGVIAVVGQASDVAALAAAADAVPAPKPPRDDRRDREAVIPAAPRSTQLDDDEDDD